MPISWGHPAAIELRKEVVGGVVEELSMEDFRKAYEALKKADLPEIEYYLLKDGSMMPRMPLEASRKPAGEFKLPDRYPYSLDDAKRISEA